MFLWINSINMETPFLTRHYLETLSSSDLVALAYDYDIDIPEGLNRRFIIGELLEVAEEINKKEKNEMIISLDILSGEESYTLPDGYNETVLTVILRNPVWAFVYWDISDEDLAMLRQSKIGPCHLHVSFYENFNDKKSSDSFDIQISLSDREQYILIPPEKNVMRVDFIYLSDGHNMNILASSKKIELVHGCKALSESRPGRIIKFSPVMELSGVNDLLRVHYAKHRQSFMK
ncbi:DUF4912 domain-containing protein [Treponema parvum]|uniref:DUF4912 domain-containing protein n=1 Tax=Treponema parvum TaxID=138851 RepID=A0A975EZS4_9SPIR|nr:DUF4912 domain-containing protein [Treponema parvum]QTQ11936.1 DUF4912 domain-containing protein [Treponema parvum]